MRVTIGMLAAVVALLSGCPKEGARADASPPASEDTCVDGWLSSHHLDTYGNAEGTMYAGGTPLFDEKTGATTDRLTYVYGKQPDAKVACHK